MTQVFAIIPARGGSKGIPRKNLALCGGRPLVDWTVEAANQSQYITASVLSSDDFEILGRATGRTQALLRHVTLAEDETTTEAVMAHALTGHTQPPDLVVLLQPTSPLRTAEHIDAAIALLLSQPFTDSVVSVVPSHAYLWNAKGTPLYPERKRRQEMEQYEENGAIYVTTYAQWRSSGNRMGGAVSLYVMEAEHQLQVDSPDDLETMSRLLDRRGGVVPAMRGHIWKRWAEGVPA